MKSDHFKNHHREIFCFRQRTSIVIATLLLFSLIIIGRLVSLQLIHHKKYTALSNNNLLTLIPIAPNRGLIYDRNHILLARNIPAFSLAIIPAKTSNLEATIKALSRIIPIDTKGQSHFLKSLGRHHRYDPVPIKLNLTEKEVARFYVNRYRFPGVVIKADLIRSYPFKNIMTPVLGYIGRINANDLNQVNTENYSASSFIGKTGIEKYYEPSLHGKVGYTIAEIDASGNIIRNLKTLAPTPGNNLSLTIDSRLQSYAYKVMGNNSGAVVAIDPNTGGILAMVSTPSFDANKFVNGISQKDFKTLVNAANHPLYNRAIRGLFSPGSTIKPFYSLAALSHHIITTKTTIFDPGWFRLAHTKHIYHDWKADGHGWVNVSQAIKVSCDTFFYNLAVQMGIKFMDNTLHEFGLGEKTNIDTSDELAGIVPSPAWKMRFQQHPWYTGDTIITGIGQGSLLVTPLQLAVATSMLAERGKRSVPHLLKSSEDSHNTVFAHQNLQRQAVLQNQTNNWNTVIKAMQAVISGPQGTAVNFGPHAYTVAGKTGTAQIYGKNRDEEYARTTLPRKLRNNHLFIAFAPVKHPQIAIAVVIEHAGVADGITAKIINKFFQLQKHDALQGTNNVR